MMNGNETRKYRGGRSSAPPRLCVMWIGKRDLLLRKMRTQSAFDDFSTIDETIYRDVGAGGSIPNATFHYSPPKEITEPAREQ